MVNTWELGTLLFIVDPDQLYNHVYYGQLSGQHCFGFPLLFIRVCSNFGTMIAIDAYDDAWLCGY